MKLRLFFRGFCAILALAGIIYMLVRPYKEATTLKA